MVQDERPISQRCGKFQKLSLHPIPNSYSCFRRSEHSKYNKKRRVECCIKEPSLHDKIDTRK
uniref:hypothetical protein n=1 Tax=Leptospira interrogans TaxID=173 RepID=UPI001B8BBDD1